MKRGRLIKGTTRAFKDNRERSPAGDPLVIDLKNKVPRKTANPGNVSPLKRVSTNSPNRKDLIQRDASYNQIFELSRVITNSRAPLDPADALVANSTASNVKPRLESLPDDSLFHPSHDPIKVLASEKNKKLTEQLRVTRDPSPQASAKEPSVSPPSPSAGRNQSQSKNQDLNDVRDASPKEE